jgi:hypothetical protein
MDVRRMSGGDYDLSNPVESFVDTVRRVVLQPVGFFAGLPRSGSLLNPLVFALICTEISVILGGILGLVGVREGFVAGYGFQIPENQDFGEFIGSVIFAPIGSAISVFVVAGIGHLLVMLVVVASYASVTSLVSWIPIIGGLLGLYGIYIAVVGIREMHQTTTGKAVIVVLFPVILILLLALLGLLVAGAVFFSRMS